MKAAKNLQMPWLAISGRLSKNAFTKSVSDCGDHNDVWNRCKQVFFEKSSPLAKDLEQEEKYIWLREEIQESERR